MKKSNTEAQERNNSIPAYERLYLPEGISFQHLEERKIHWLRAHDKLIRWVCFQALFRPADPERIRENIMQITLEPRWDDRNPAQFFGVKDIRVTPLHMAQGWSEDWKISLEWFKTWRDRLEGSDPVRRVALILHCPPLVPTFRHIEVLPTACNSEFWRNCFIAEVEGFHHSSPNGLESEEAADDLTPLFVEQHKKEGFDPLLLDIPVRQH